MRVLAFALLVALQAGASTQSAFSFVLLRDGAAPARVDVTAVVDLERRGDLGANLKVLVDKYARGTRVDVYKRMCDGPGIELILVPAGENLPYADRDCAKVKEAPPGAPCFCRPLGAFQLSGRVTIDAETGRIVEGQ